MATIRSGCVGEEEEEEEEEEEGSLLARTTKMTDGSCDPVKLRISYPVGHEYCSKLFVLPTVSIVREVATRTRNWTSLGPSGNIHEIEIPLVSMGREFSSNQWQTKSGRRMGGHSFKRVKSWKIETLPDASPKTSIEAAEGSPAFGWRKETAVMEEVCRWSVPMSCT